MLRKEAGYVAMGECMQEVLFLCNVFDFLRPELGTKSVKVFKDNEGVLDLARKLLRSGRMKHTDVFHIFQDAIREGKIDVKLVPSCNQHTDVLTKLLQKQKRSRSIATAS